MVSYIRQSRGMFKQIKVCHFCQNEKQVSQFCPNEKQISVRKTMRKRLTIYYIHTCKILIGKF